MQDLNDRLASYLDKVHFLKAANATLEKQIREYCEKKGLICQRDYSCYFKTIDCLQEKVQNGRLVKLLYCEQIQYKNTCFIIYDLHL